MAKVQTFRPFTEPQRKLAIVWTQPHGAQIVHRINDADEVIHQGDHDGNALYRIRDDSGKEMVFTGLELDSLAQQWQTYKDTSLSR